MLVKLPEFKPASAINVLQAFTDKLLGIAQPMRLSMTYDQGREMSMHKKLSERSNRPCRKSRLRNTGVAFRGTLRSGATEDRSSNGAVLPASERGPG
jgi:hypothetical protein